MKLTKSIVLCAILSLLICVLLGTGALASTEGATFTKDAIYKARVLDALPQTFEATLCLPADREARSGVIIGSYSTSEIASANFEIHDGGNPRIYLIDDSETAYSIVFDEVDVCTGEWVHVAVVLCAADGTASCYVDGELRQTLETEIPEHVTFENKTVLGGDNRDVNGQYFKGALKNVALYSDVRTAEEILSDSRGEYGTDGLMGLWEPVEGENRVEDKSGNGRAFTADMPYIYDYETPTDYAYSFAVIGDTQIMSYKYHDVLENMYDWIVDNVEEKNIQFVFGLGDITDRCTDKEWSEARYAIHKLEGVVPYSIVRGNHDRYDGCFEEYFDFEDYGDNVDGSFDGTMKNTYQTFTVGEIKYLVLNLDFTFTDDAIWWANEVVEAHPDYNVIINTHIYLNTAGNRISNIKYGSSHTAEYLWNNLVSKHENIVLVLSGHVISEYVRMSVDEGEHGNRVVQMLIDPQGSDKTRGGVGLVAMLYFSEDGRQVDVQYYSTAKDALYREANQFHLELDVVESRSTPATAVTDSEGASPLLILIPALALVFGTVAVVIIKRKR